MFDGFDEKKPSVGKSLALLIMSALFTSVAVFGACWFMYNADSTVDAVSVIGCVALALLFFVNSVTFGKQFCEALKYRKEEKYSEQWDHTIIEHWDGCLPPDLEKVTKPDGTVVIRQKK